jgi:Zn-dependent metalloprotease
MTCRRNPLYCIVPPQLLHRLLKHENKVVREAALRTLIGTARLRGQREILSQTFAPLSAGGGLRRKIFDAGHHAVPDGTVVRTEGAPPSPSDAPVNEAYDGLGDTYRLYKEVFNRDSIDGKGMELDGVVHYSTRFNNAFWNGSRMVFGDGDGISFVGFTKAIDVIGHELTHGVTEFTCNLEYHRQSGALNESMSDVFGSLVKQYALKQDAASADWLIGAGILGPAIHGVALRSMKEPGTAFDGDDQPGDMAGYEESPDTEAGDWGGVHRNSGIPNHAFYLAAIAIGGNAWDAAGQIWYDTLLALDSTSDFQDCANLSYMMAGKRYGQGSAQQQAVQDAWSHVGLTPVGAAIAHAAAHVPSSDGKLRGVLEKAISELKHGVALLDSP